MTDRSRVATGTAVAIIAGLGVWWTSSMLSDDDATDRQLPTAALVVERDAPPPPSLAPAAVSEVPGDRVADDRDLPDLGAGAARPVDRSRARPADGDDDLARRRVQARLVGPGSDAAGVAPARESRVDLASYRVTRGGQRVILTSGRRIGLPEVHLPDTAEAAVLFQQEGGARIGGVVCVNRRGRPTEVDLEQGSSSEKINRHVAQTLLRGRYRPLTVEGRRVPFCEPVTVVLARR